MSGDETFDDELVLPGHPPLEIPMFNQEEASAIEVLFRDHGIAYKTGTIQLRAGRMGGRHAYVFHVRRAQFMAAIGLLKEFFHIGGGTEFSGECPACGAAVVEKRACGVCGLNLSGDREDALAAHPFVIYLREWALV